MNGIRADAHPLDGFRRSRFHSYLRLYREATWTCYGTPSGALVHRRIDLLAEFPEYGRTGRKPDTRELVFSGLPYVAIYRIQLDLVEILRILHGAQDGPE